MLTFISDQLPRNIFSDVVFGETLNCLAIVFRLRPTQVYQFKFAQIRPLPVRNYVGVLSCAYEKFMLHKQGNLTSWVLP